MESHVRVLGMLHIALSVLMLFGGIVALLVLGGIGGIAAMVGGQDAENSLAAAGVLGIIGVAVFLILFVLSLPGIICGWGIMRFRPWAKTLGIVMSAFDLLNVPVGTILGIYGLWVLTNNATEPLFRPRTFSA